MTLKILPKSQRESNRYVQFVIESSKEIPANLVEKAILEQFKELFGLWGLGDARIQFRKEKYKYPRGIVITNAKGVDKLKTSFLFIDNINKIPCTIKSERVSGTIKNVKNNI